MHGTMNVKFKPYELGRMEDNTENPNRTLEIQPYWVA
jgi:hypothetical protein